MAFPGCALGSRATPRAACAAAGRSLARIGACEVTDPTAMPSGWFPDPHGRHEYRWFNGHAWTADVADAGRRMIDPHGAAPLRRGAGAGAGNGIAVAAMTCGLVALVYAWMPLFVVIGVVLGVLGLVFGIRGRRRARQVGSGEGMALTGIISGSAALALSIVGIVFTVSFIRDLVATLTDVAPGASEQLTMHHTARATDPGECEVRLVVHGPTPYGLEIDRV